MSDKPGKFIYSAFKDQVIKIWTDTQSETIHYADFDITKDSKTNGVATREFKFANGDKLSMSTSQVASRSVNPKYQVTISFTANGRTSQFSITRTTAVEAAGRFVNDIFGIAADWEGRVI